MNYTEKRLEEFDREFVKDCGPDVEPIFICAVGSVGPIRQFLSESITQALAEERERVVERLEDIKEKNPGSIYGFESISNGGIDYAIEEIKLLSSLDPLTDK